MVLVRDLNPLAAVSVLLDPASSNSSRFCFLIYEVLIILQTRCLSSASNPCRSAAATASKPPSQTHKNPCDHFQ